MTKPSFSDKGKPSKKRVKLTPAQRMYIWDNPKKYGRTCSICGEKIRHISDLELDHTRPYSKGGTKLALAHRNCNRMKASGTLAKIQKKMVFKTKTEEKPTEKKAQPIIKQHVIVDYRGKAEFPKDGDFLLINCPNPRCKTRRIHYYIAKLGKWECGVCHSFNANSR